MRPDGTIRSDHASETQLDRAVTEALERRPEIAVPADFAAQAMARLAKEPPGQVSADQAAAAYRHRGRASVARAMGYASAAAATAGLAALAIANPAALQAGKSIAFAVEMLLVAELLGVGLWLGTQRDA